MNLCNANGKLPDLRRHRPTQRTPKWINNPDQLHQTLSNARMCLFLLSFCDQSWGFGIKASYFFRAFSSKKMVTVSQQECFGLERIEISLIIVYLLAQYELSCNLIGSPDVYYQRILPFRSVMLHSQGR